MARKQRRIVDHSLEGKYYGQSLPSPANPTSKMNMYDLSALGFKSLEQFRKFMESGLGGSGFGNGSQTPKAGSSLNILENDGSYWSNLLAMLGNNTDLTDFLNSLLDIGADNAGRIGTYPEDVRKKLVEMFLNNMVSQEQRGFDYSMLQDQRKYDSPTNQLARLMGAGVSRDAAIQLLGQGGETPMIGSGAGLSAGEPFKSTTDQVMQGLNMGLSALGTIGSLVSLGFSVPQAIQQTRFLKNQNLLTQRQIAAYDSAGDAYSILSAAGSKPSAFDSVGSAVNAIQNLAQTGNNMAAQFIQNGGVAKLEQNAPFASNVLRDLYKSENGAEMFRKEMRAQDLANELTNAKVETEYQNILESLQRVLESDERVKLYREQLRTQQQITKQESYAAEYADFQSDVLKSMRHREDAAGNDIVDLMSFNQFNDVWMQFKEAAARISDPDKFDNWIHDNWNAACDLATINAIANNTYKINYDSDEPTIMSSILRFARLMNDSGVGASLERTFKNAQSIANFLTPVSTK